MFCPQLDVSRAQMAAFLTRAFDYTVDQPNAFLDDGLSIFESDIDALASAGVTKGCNPPLNDHFCPDRPISRGEMAAFLVRALGLPPGPDAFTDDDGSQFEPAIDALAGAGITKGCNPPVNDRFCPGSPLTRGEMAALLHRALG
ncbi:MAG: S-layer homology domain-containing protein, partial [Acidimicrobiia bacterium]